ncbi:FecCD family ABC transporter permease [Vallitalea pronyensis]|nr:iron ABC transporter permease [Vallitalea pronyensis]
MKAMTSLAQQDEQKNRRYKLSILGILFVFLFVSVILSITLGATHIPLKKAFQALFVEKDGLTYHIIMNIRMPRTLVGMLVGISLSLSGAILQGIMRNSLASPNIIGVSSGAGLAATICIVLLPAYVNLTPIAAFIGAFLTTMIIYSLSYKNGVRPLRMVLAGVAISSLVSALINLILIFFPDRVSDTLSFTIGSLNLALWSDFYRLLPYVIVGFILCLLNARKINVLMLGDEIATSLGVHVERSRFFFIALASLLAASSISVVGLLGFVGLIVPHIVKLLIGSNYRYVYVGVTFFGGGIVIFCDTIARVIAAPMEIPVGINMAILGVPFFLYLLRGRIAHD